MSPAQSEKIDLTVSPRVGRPALTFVAGLLALAIAAALVLEDRGARSSVGGESRDARTMPVASFAPAPGASVTIESNASTPAPQHFDRSNEPATDDDPARPYGG
jgi:hypothetical protein